MLFDWFVPEEEPRMSPNDQRPQHTAVSCPGSFTAVRYDLLSLKSVSRGNLANDLTRTSSLLSVVYVVCLRHFCEVCQTEEGMLWFSHVNIQIEIFYRCCALYSHKAFVTSMIRNELRSCFQLACKARNNLSKHL